MTPQIISQKKSGNFIIKPFVNDSWTLVAKCNTPQELLSEIKKLPKFSTIIKAEYSQSQLKTSACRYDKKDALRAFNVPATNINLKEYFTN